MVAKALKPAYTIGLYDGTYAQANTYAGNFTKDVQIIKRQKSFTSKYIFWKRNYNRPGQILMQYSPKTNDKMFWIICYLKKRVYAKNYATAF